jgi:hypothetical protein
MSNHNRTEILAAIARRNAALAASLSQGGASIEVVRFIARRFNIDPDNLVASETRRLIDISKGRFS